MPPWGVCIIAPEFSAALAGLTITVKVDQRKQDRRMRKGAWREHGKRVQQRRRAHLVLYPRLVIVEADET